MVEDVVDVDLEIRDRGPVAVTEAVPDVVVAEHEELLFGRQPGRELGVPLEVFSVPVGEEQQTLISVLKYVYFFFNFSFFLP